MKALCVDVPGWVMAAIAVFVLLPVAPAAAEEEKPPVAADADDDGDREETVDRDKVARQIERAREQAKREKARARREAEHAKARARREAEHAKARARKAVEKARQHARAIAEQRALASPEVVVVPGDRDPEVIVIDEHADRAPRERRHARNDDGAAARGGLLASAGAANGFNIVPLGGELMASARVQVAMALPGDSVRWLSNAVLGLSGGVDAGSNRGTSAQLYRGGLMLGIGAPWTHDVIGLGIEGGLLAGRYYDSNPVASHGESMSARFYGVGRFTVQVPLKGDVRPFLAVEAGGAEAADGRASGLGALTGGLVWNAW